MKNFLLLSFLCLVQFGCASTGVIGSSEKVKSEYDRFKNQTVYETPKIRLLAPTFSQSILLDKPHKLDLSSVIICDGNELCKTDKVMMLFESSSHSWEYLRVNSLIIIIDDETFDYGDIEHDGSVMYGGVVELLSFFMNIDDFHRFADAESVEMRLGIDEFQVPFEDRQVFRNMVNLINEVE